MRKLIDGKVRDLEKMSRVIVNDGDSNDCYGCYSRIMFDPRDGSHYMWSGHYCSGLGEDTLFRITDVLARVEELGWTLSENEAAYVEKLRRQKKEYMILWWKSEDDNYLTTVQNNDGSVMLFETILQADSYADTHDCADDMRVVSIEGVQVWN